MAENWRYSLHTPNSEPESELTAEEHQLDLPDSFSIDSHLLRASNDKSLHYLLPEILSKDKQYINSCSENDEIQNTPLLLVTREGCSLETLDVMLGAGADVTARNAWGLNALHYAVHGKCPLSVIRKLVQCNMELVNQRDKDGRTPLLLGLIAYTCSLEVFRELVDCGGADVSIPDIFGKGHLHWAAEKVCCQEILEKIIRLKPELVHQKSDYGRIPLHHALDERVVRTLIEAGSNPVAKDNMGFTPLQRALVQEEVTESALEVYLECMSSEQFQQVNKLKDTLLHVVCRENRGVKLVQRLLKMGVDPAKKNIFGDTALLYAAKAGSVEVCKELLRGKPHLADIKNDAGKLVVEVTDNIECCKEIIKWVCLQSEDIALRTNLAIKDQPDKNDIVLFWNKCQAELELFQVYCVRPKGSDTEILYLKDLLLKTYLAEEDILSAIVWEECDLALNLDAGILSVFEKEVRQVQDKVLDSL